MSWFSHVLNISSSLISDDTKLERNERTNQTHTSEKNTKPHVVIVLAACNVPYQYRLFTGSLESAGYNVTVQWLLANVEHGSGPLPDAMSKSIAAVRAAVMKQIARSHDVVVIGHSAGGAVIGGALVGLGKKGSKPGVVRLIYLADFLMGPGESFLSATQGNGPQYMEFRDGFVVIPKAKEWLYHGVPDDIAEDAADHFVGRGGCLATVSVQAVCWHEIPSVYVMCGKDKAIPSAIADQTIASAQLDCEIVRIEAGHSPFLSMPDKLTEIVRWVAGEYDADLEGVAVYSRKTDAMRRSQEAGRTENNMANSRQCTP